MNKNTKKSSEEIKEIYDWVFKNIPYSGNNEKAILVLAIMCNKYYHSKFEE